MSDDQEQDEAGRFSGPGGGGASRDRLQATNTAEVERRRAAEKEVERLNKWADDYTDKLLNERRLAEELIQNAVNVAATAMERIRQLEDAGEIDRLRADEKLSEEQCEPGGNYGLCKHHPICEFVRSEIERLEKHRDDLQATNTATIENAKRDVENPTSVRENTGRLDQPRIDWKDK